MNQEYLNEFYKRVGLKSLNESLDLKITENPDGDLYIKNKNSYVKFEKMKDTYNLVEFSGLDLKKIYEVIGDSCIYIRELYIEPNESPILIKGFLKTIEEYGLKNDYDSIVLVAEPFKDKRMSLNRLVELYENFNYLKFSNFNSNSVLMYKRIK